LPRVGLKVVPSKVHGSLNAEIPPLAVREKLVRRAGFCKAWMMTPKSYTHSYVVGNDGSLSFACSQDAQSWPWLRLHPFDPIVVQTLNFYVAHEPAIFRERYAPGQWTALTNTGWKCGARNVGPAVRGVAKPPPDEDSVTYDVNLYDRDDALVYRLYGEGVVFRNRDFAAWRQGQKRELGPEMDLAEFAFIDASAVGVGTSAEVLVSVLEPGPEACAQALVTAENGFPPLHPYHDGSGDHVNATHLADAARQFLALLVRTPTLTVVDGEMHFERYVELGYPFRLRQEGPVSRKRVLAQARVSIEQFDRRCAFVDLSWEL